MSEDDAPHPVEDIDPTELAAEPWSRRLERVESVKPPHSLEAEREVLAATLVDNACIDALVALPIVAADFYADRHRRVFAAMVELRAAGGAIDVVTLRQALQDRGEYERIGGARALGELLDRTGTTEHLAHYARIVRDKARVRQVLETAQAIAAQALADVYDVDGFVDSAKVRIGVVLEQVAKPVESLVLDSLAERVAKGAPNWLEIQPPDASALMRNPDGSPYMLDSRVGVISAAGGTGKSWLVIQLAIAVACGGRWLEHYDCRKGRVLLALGEEQDEEIWRRVWRICKHLQLTDYERAEVARNLVPMGLDGEEVAFLRKAPDGNITTTPFFARLQKALEGGSWRLVLLDPLSYFGGPEVESDPYVATTLIRCGAKLTRANGRPAIVFSAHSRKRQQGTAPTALDAGDTRGSSAIVDGSRWVCSMVKRSDTITAMRVTKTNYTVPGDELLLARGQGGVMRPATQQEIAQDIEERKEARAKAKGL